MIPAAAAIGMHALKAVHADGILFCAKAQCDLTYLTRYGSKNLFFWIFDMEFCYLPNCDSPNVLEILVC